MLLAATVTEATLVESKSITKFSPSNGTDTPTAIPVELNDSPTGPNVVSPDTTPAMPLLATTNAPRPWSITVVLLCTRERLRTPITVS
jgi:hypothetical protein